MKRPWTWVGKAIVTFLGTVWCGVLLYLCIWCPMAFAGNSTYLDSIQVMSKGWILMSAFAFAYFLFFSTSSLRPYRRQGGGIRVGDLHEAIAERKAMFKGLVGGLLCSFPALAITLVGLMVSVPHPDSWITDGTLSRLATKGLVDEGALQLSPSSKRAFLIGIDLSKSTLRNSRDPRLQQVCKALDALFVRELNSGFPGVIKSEDTPKFYVFGASQKPLYPTEYIFDRLSNAQISSRVCVDLAGLVDQLNGRVDDVGRGSTDIIQFMEDMVGRMKAQSEYSEMTLIIFSDFRQDNTTQTSRDLQERLGSIMTDVDALGQQVVGFSLPTDTGDVESRGIDIRPSLEQHRWADYGERRLWKELDLYAIEKKQLDLRMEIQRSLYREDRHPFAMHLKYRVFPSWKGVPSYLDLPKVADYDRVLLSLRPADRDDAALSEISVAFGDPARNPVVLKMGEVAEYRQTGSKPASLPITLFSYKDVSRSAEFDLLVIVPSGSIIHTVRLVVLPTVGHSLPLDIMRWALGLAAVTFVLLVVGASGTDLWLKRRFSWASRRLKTYKSS